MPSPETNRKNLDMNKPRIRIYFKRRHDQKFAFFELLRGNAHPYQLFTPGETTRFFMECEPKLKAFYEQLLIANPNAGYNTAAFKI
jgi:hypothetical protein